LHSLKTERQTLKKKSPDSKHALKDLTDPEKQTVAGNKIPLKSEIDSPLQKQEKPFTMPNQTEIQLHERENKSPNLDEQRLEESAKKLNLIKTTISILTDKIQLHFQELIQQITKITIVDKLIPLVDKMKSVRSELLSAEELVPFEKVEKTRPSMQDGKLKFAIDVLSYEIQKIIKMIVDIKMYIQQTQNIQDILFLAKIVKTVQANVGLSPT